jgi:hypothetical protein
MPSFFVMDKYIVRFTTTDGDYDKEWCHANSPQEAEENIKREHWNIKEVTMVSKIS